MSDTSNAAQSDKCRYCGNYHGPLCPDVKAIEYHPNGTVKRVEFKTAADYPQVVTHGNLMWGGWDGLHVRLD